MRALGRAVVVVMVACASRAHSNPASEAVGSAGAAPRLVSPRAAAAQVSAPASADTSLATTTAVPWNPPAPLTDSETWERVVRAPGRMVSLPLVGLGALTSAGLAFVEDHDVVPRVTAFLTYQGNLGLGVLPASLGDRTGLGAELRFQPPWFRTLIADVSGSTGGYSRARVALAHRFAKLEFESSWREHDQFFGGGLDAPRLVSAYASQAQSVRATLATAWHPITRRRPRLDASAWAGPREIVVLDGRDPVKPNLSARFPVIAAAQLGTHVEHLVYGARLALDARHGGPHWTDGYRVAVRADRFDQALGGFVLRSAYTPAMPFVRITYEAEGGVSFWRDPRTVRLAIRVVDQDRGSAAGLFLIPDLASLGGSSGLAGFEPARFQALDAAVAKLSYIFPLGRYLELDAHTEAGGVYPDLADLRASTLVNSYGLALRIRSLAAVLANVGVDWSAETVRIRFSLGGVE